MPDTLAHYYLPKMKFKYTLSGIEEDLIDIYNVFKRRLPEDRRRELEQRESELINAVLKEKARRESGSLTEYVINNPWVLYVGGSLLVYFLFVKRR